jgi:hypothetical protein
MSQPVKLSDSLVLEARLTGEVMERSIAGQVEYWAQLGRAVDRLLGGQQALRLRQSGKTESLFDSLVSVDTEAGRARVKAYLESRPFPHFESYHGQEGGQKGLLVRIEENGTRTVGRFVDRKFTAVDLPVALEAAS